MEQRGVMKIQEGLQFSPEVKEAMVFVDSKSWSDREQLSDAGSRQHVKLPPAQNLSVGGDLGKGAHAASSIFIVG